MTASPADLKPLVRRRLARRLFLCSPLVVYAAICGSMMALEERLLYFPLRHPAGEWRPAGLPVEDAWFEAGDGVRLHGWYVEHPRPRAVVLFAHGNAGNITHRVDQLRRLHAQLRVSVLAYDYRGFGRSGGRPPREAELLADARAARAWVAQRAGVEEREIVLLGESLGGGAMVDLAAADGARGLVLENTFTSLPDVAAPHYPWLPVRWLMRNRLDSLSKIGSYRGPLLQCHGELDAIVPLAVGRRLFDAANEPKRFVELRDHDHNDPLPSEWWTALDEFLADL